MHELWRELGQTMRDLRRGAGWSLRQVEAESGIGRGTLSQIETGRTRPNLRAVDWYEARFQGDGKLHSMLMETRGLVPGLPPSRPQRASIDREDVLRVMRHDPPSGALTVAGDTLAVNWLVRNVGTVPWRDRRVQRLGLHVGPRVLASKPDAPLPDCDPGKTVWVTAKLEVPHHGGSYVAYWRPVDAAGAFVMDPRHLLAVELVVDE